MKYSDILKPGKYRVTMTIKGEIEVDAGNEVPTAVEYALQDTQDLFGSVTDWNIERLDK